MLEKITLLLGDAANGKSDLINVLIDLCKDEAITFCHLDYYSDDLDTIVIQMVIEKFNKIGNEGISSVGFSGVSENILEDYSAPIVRMLRRKRKLITC
jgi:hypothetical protein